jgi:hypothetical protein
MADVFLDSFSCGQFRVRSKSGKQTLYFDDSEQFGPSLILNPRTGDLTEMPTKSWFWAFYPSWREAGRPTQGEPKTSEHGTYSVAAWAEEHGTADPQIVVPGGQHD